MPTPLPRRLRRLPLTLLLLLALAAAAALSFSPNAPAYADATDPNAGPDEGDLCFLYTGDGMADPDRRDFPVQPDYAPDLPFTITDTVATSTGPDPDILGYIWHVKNADVDLNSGNVVFAFAGYAVTHQPYLDIKVKGDDPGQKEIDATMYTIEPDDITPLRVRQAKKGKTKVVIGEDGPPLVDGDLGFVRLYANPSSIGVGESASLTAELLTPERNHDNTSGVDARVVSPYASDPVPTADGYASFPAVTFDDANYYPLAAAAEGYTPDTPGVLVVVEVASLTPDRGVQEDTTIQTGPNNFETEVWLVPVSSADDKVTVTALPNPAVPEQDLPASWSLRVGEGGNPAPFSGGHPSDTKTRVTLDINANQTILLIATCGTLSEKRIELRGVAVEEWRPADEITVSITSPTDADQTGDPEAHYLPINHRLTLTAIASDRDEYRTEPDGEWYEYNDIVNDLDHNGVDIGTEEAHHIYWEVGDGDGKLIDPWGNNAEYVAPDYRGGSAGGTFDVEVRVYADDVNLGDDRSGANDSAPGEDSITLTIWQVTVAPHQSGHLDTDFPDCDIDGITDVTGGGQLGLLRHGIPEGCRRFAGATLIEGDVPAGPGIIGAYEWTNSRQGWIIFQLSTDAAHEWRILEQQETMQTELAFNEQVLEDHSPTYPHVDSLTTSPIGPDAVNTGHIYLWDAPGLETGANNDGGIADGYVSYWYQKDFESYVTLRTRLIEERNVTERISNTAEWTVDIVIVVVGEGDDRHWALIEGHQHIPGLME